MSQQIVYNLLKEMDRANVDELFDYAKKKQITKADSRVKIRDSLILLSRNGYVKEENGKWVIVSGSPEPHFKQQTHRIEKRR